MYLNIIGLINNAALLIALALLYDVLEFKFRVWKHPFLKEFLVGILLGGIGMAIMLNPMDFSQGVIFDTRSVLLCISGFFFGAIPVLTAMLMSAVFRLWLGGVGAWTGVAVIATSGIIGLAWRHFRRSAKEDISAWELYLLGVAVHIVMLACMLMLPRSVAMDVLVGISLPVILLYPLTTMILGMLLVNREKRRQTRKEMASHYALLRMAAQTARFGGWSVDLRNNICTWSDIVADIHEMPRGYSPPINDGINFYAPEWREKITRVFRDCSEKGIPYDEEMEIITKKGKRVWVWTAGEAVRDADGRIVSVQGAFQDITERKRAEKQLRKSEEKYRNIFENVQDVYYETSLDSVLLEISPSIEAISRGQFRQADLIGRQMLDFYDDAEERDRLITKLLETGSVSDFEISLRNRDGFLMPCSISAKLLCDNRGNPVKIIGTMRDITDRKRVEEEREKLRDQLIQAQKMESIGRLAGGVAHDFNNMLSIILGHAELGRDRVDVDHPVYNDLVEIEKAGRRSADLVRQLLAFARKQTIAPRPLDLNETVEGMLKMMRRLIGEDIDIAWQPWHDLTLVNMDPSQLDQILANLCVNARDAIAGVGKITMETKKVHLDDNYCANHPDCLPGDYVMLALSDNGCGMDVETQSRIFEPFFTTKGVGEGTGLGLATVYGIVKQNNGFINVYSELGKGTTFRIYLPGHKEQAVAVVAATPDHVLTGRGETVLVVEDDQVVLNLAVRILKGLGYTVLDASDPISAEKLAKSHADDIDLLLTDVVMPSMSGRDLADRLKASYPLLRVLYMSGYTADIIAHRGILDKGMHFIAKPFSRTELAAKVREALLE